TDPSFLNLGIQPGVVYGRDYGKIVGVAQASYTINLENGDDYKNGNVLHVYVKPGYKLNENLMAYLGVDYDMFSETEVAGNGFGDDGYLLSLLPGATYRPSPALMLEANVPFTVAGKNTDAMWGVGLTARYTIGL